jgi:hypothetical protein
MSAVGQTRSFSKADIGRTIYEPAVGGRAERPTKKSPARRGAEVKEARVGLSRLLSPHSPDSVVIFGAAFTIQI